MITRAKVELFVEAARSLPVLDVRSPGEFEHGHIPGAKSFPLFDNEERAEVGTIYKQAGQLEAMSRGMDLIGPKVGRMFAEGVATARNGRLLVHCWRGGKRSEAVAGLLNVAGINVTLLDGGYKAFRNWVLTQFEKQWPLVIVGGTTGSGKTEVLQMLGRLGENILDLEALADHRGSAFGRLGAERDVTFTQFENDMAWELSALKAGTVWIEDESRNLGRLQLPNTFWKQKIAAPIYLIDLPRQVRMERLMKDYGGFSLDELEGSILKIKRRLGGLRTKETLDALHAGDSEKVMDILLDYYDNAYLHATADHHVGRVVKFAFDRFDAEEIASRFIAAQKEGL